MQATPDEFRDLCYLLTCRSIQEAPSFKNWEGVNPSRYVLRFTKDAVRAPC